MKGALTNMKFLLAAFTLAVMLMFGSAGISETINIAKGSGKDHFTSEKA